LINSNQFYLAVRVNFAMRKQKNLDKFLSIVDEDKGSSGDPSSGAEEFKQPAVA